MGQFRPFFAIAIGAFALLSCEGRDFFEELQPTPPEALNGIYREKSTQAETAENPSTLTELHLDRGVVQWVRIRETPPVRVEWIEIAKIGSGPGLSLELTSTPTLFAQEDDRLASLKQLFSENSKVRILRQGTDLKITEIRGLHRRTTTWEKISSLEFDSSGEKVPSAKLQEAVSNTTILQELQGSFFDHWKDKTAETRERQRTMVRQQEEVALRSEGESDPFRELPDETLSEAEPGETPKKIVAFNRLKLVSPTQVLINETHAGDLKLTLRPRPNGTPGLYLDIDLSADLNVYQAASLSGFVDLEDNGFRINQPAQGRMIGRTFRLVYLESETGSPDVTDPASDSSIP